MRMMGSGWMSVTYSICAFFFAFPFLPPFCAKRTEEHRKKRVTKSDVRKKILFVMFGLLFRLQKYTLSF